MILDDMQSTQHDIFAHVDKFTFQFSVITCKTSYLGLGDTTDETKITDQ